MSTLLIDIGNSRVKWFCDAIDTPLTRATLPHAVSHHENNWLDTLRSAWQGITPRACRISSVASADVLNNVAQLIKDLWGVIPIDVLNAQQHPWNTHYNTAQMGSDRYAQLLGAQEICATQNHLVISAGTATTVDGVLDDGRHMGGIILPSSYLMRSSLSQYTAQLPQQGGVFCAQHAPQNTTDALQTGAALATIGAITEFARRYMPPTYDVVLCGGSAAQIAQALPTTTLHIVPSLCLLGLRRGQHKHGD